MPTALCNDLIFRPESYAFETLAARKSRFSSLFQSTTPQRKPKAVYA